MNQIMILKVWILRINWQTKDRMKPLDNPIECGVLSSFATNLDIKCQLAITFSFLLALGIALFILMIIFLFQKRRYIITPLLKYNFLPIKVWLENGSHRRTHAISWTSNSNECLNIGWVGDFKRQSGYEQKTWWGSFWTSLWRRVFHWWKWMGRSHL